MFYIRMTLLQPYNFRMLLEFIGHIRITLYSIFYVSFPMTLMLLINFNNILKL